MRKVYPLIFLLSSIISFSHAQNPTPNAGFEDWTENPNGGSPYYTPDNWSNLNPETYFAFGILTCLRCDTPHSGNYAVELVTDSAKGEPPVDGIMTTGTIDILTQNVVGGVPFSQRPDSIYGWIKYYPIKKDSAGVILSDSTEIQFSLLGSSGNVIGLATHSIGDSITNYTRFSSPVIYTDTTSAIDTAQWIISSSNGHHAYIGSRLYVDDIGLIGPGAGIATPALKPVTISVMPNPASGFILLSNPEQYAGILSLFNTTGAVVKQIQLNSVQQNIDIHDLASGDYLYSIKDEDGNPLANGSIIVK
jgi:hypothetical protein